MGHELLCTPNYDDSEFGLLEWVEEEVKVVYTEDGEIRFWGGADMTGNTDIGLAVEEIEDVGEWGSRMHAASSMGLLLEIDMRPGPAARNDRGFPGVTLHGAVTGDLDCWVKER